MEALVFEMMIEPGSEIIPTTVEMVNAILSQIEPLEPRRKYMFMAWLHAHSSHMKKSENIHAGLCSWFESMPDENAKWEYRLIIQEIEWWLEQNEQKVELLMIDHFAERNA